jgi:hypothetical protein
MNMPGLQVRRLFQGQIGTSWGYWAKAWENQKGGRLFQAFYRSRLDEIRPVGQPQEDPEWIPECR